MSAHRSFYRMSCATAFLSGDPSLKSTPTVQKALQPVVVNETLPVQLLGCRAGGPLPRVRGPGDTSLPTSPSAPSHGHWGQRGWPGLSQPVHDSPGTPPPHRPSAVVQKSRQLGPMPQLRAASFRDPTFKLDLPSKPPQEMEAPAWARGTARMGPAAPARLTQGEPLRGQAPVLFLCSRLFC